MKRSLSSSEKFVKDGREFPKFEYFEYEGDDYAVPTIFYEKYLTSLEEELTPTVSFECRSLSDYSGLDSAKNIPKLIRYVDEFEKNFSRHSIYIWSKFNSTQKTTVSKAVLKGIHEKNQKRKCNFILANSLMSDLKNSDFDQKASQRIELLKKSDCLVIDDAFTSDKVTKYGSGYQISFLDTFLRERLEVLGKATLFTSNIPIDEIGRQWGASIEALIRRNTFSMEFNDILGKDTDFDINHIFD
ncbi:MAG: hypothetical protein ACRCZB_05285 [Bacteroidales bacterium]